MAFLDMLRFQLTTRAEFERLIGQDPERLTDLQRAARFLYLQKTAFGGKVVGQNFGVDVGRGGRFDVTKLVPLLEDLHTRLAGVIIERLSFERFIPRYDAPDTLFYVDPPYYGTEDYYGAELFSRADFETLRATLAVIKGRFILSINDCPQTREIFSEFEIRAASTTYSVSGGPAQAAGELIILGPCR
ncbi:MAG: DNA adenine methylase [Caulobacteraceae bacterium]